MSARDDVFPEPGSEAQLVEVAARQGEDGTYDLFFGGIDAKPVQPEEQIHGLEGHALVAVDKGVVLGDAEAVCRGQRREIGLGIVTKSISGALEGGLQESAIPKAVGSAMSLNLVRMDGENMRDNEPTRFGHLASSRIALRYFLAPSA